ncbi:MAG: hypothetical protein AB1638_07000 [Nitrospirota bacterium]
MNILLRIIVVIICLGLAIPLLAVDHTKIAGQEGLWKDIKKEGHVKPDKENLEKNKDLVTRYNEYWKAIVARDYKKAYAMESTDYQKKVGYDLYAERLKNRINIKAVEPIEVKQLNEKEVVVRGFMRYQIEIIDSMRTFDDKWIKEGERFKHQRDTEEEAKKSSEK